MAGWQQIRTLVLAVTCLSVAAVLGKSLLAADAPQPAAAITSVELPQQVPLPGWEPVAVQPIDTTEPRLMAAQRYDYERQGKTLAIEMRYVRETSGNVQGFVRRSTDLPSAVLQPGKRLEQYEEGVGYYVLYAHQQRAYLTSCINPRGESTVTAPQFQQNRYRHDLTLDRLGRWLLYAEKIRDYRCLWVHMSIPVQTTTPELAYADLKAAWVPWYQWWQPRFPDS